MKGDIEIDGKTYPVRHRWRDRHLRNSQRDIQRETMSVRWKYTHRHRLRYCDKSIDWGYDIAGEIRNSRRVRYTQTERNYKRET